MLTLACNHFVGANLWRCSKLYKIEYRRATVRLIDEVIHADMIIRSSSDSSHECLLVPPTAANTRRSFQLTGACLNSFSVERKVSW